MKNGLLFFVLFCFVSSYVSAQNISNSILATQGQYDEVTEVGLEWTLGEVAAETSELRSVVFTKGFNQPDNFIIPHSSKSSQDALIRNVSGITANQSLHIDFLPNPFENELTVTIVGDRYSVIHASLYSTEGVLLRKSSISIQDTEVRFDVSDLPSAIYIVYIQDDTGGITESHRVFKFK